ncbi:MAG: TonB-dependent receptor [Candidatus Hydrothermae bacterium]|nr:TonB-dependent receptor [Candidatus Hydrothermae bacterium]
MKLLILLLLAISNSQEAWGPFYLKEVLVTASRYGDELFTAPFSSAVLYPQEDRWHSSFLAYPGLSVRDYGNLLQISRRGTASEENLLLLEGVPLNSPQSGTVDLQLIPPSFIDRVEIRSGGSSLLGPGAMGGALALSLLGTGGRFSGSLSAGNFSRRGISFTGRKSIGGFALTFAADASGEKGNYPYKDTWGKMRFRENNDSKRLAAALKLTSVNFDGFFMMSNLECGVPGPVGSPMRSRRLESLTVAKLGLKKDPCELRVFLSRDYLEYLGKPSTEKILGNILGFTAAVASPFRIRGGATLQSGSSTRTGKKKKLDLFLTGGQKVILGPLKLTPEFYLSTTPPDPPLLTYFLGAGLSAAKDVFLYANFSTNLRRPTFNELYWQGDPFASGNPNLRPEKGWLTEGGIRMRNSRLSFDISFYTGENRDMIVWEPTEDGLWSPRNKKEVILMGNETHIYFKFKFLLLYLFYGLNSITSEGRQLMLRPLHSGRLEVSAPFFKARLNFVGERYERPSGPKKMPSFLTFDILFRFERNFDFGDIGVELCIYNVFDRQYELVRGYPLPGRYFNLKVSANIL